MFDIDLFKVKKFAQTWDVKYFYNKIEDFLNHTNFDIISICTPTITHLNIYQKVIHYNPKVIWLEKPSGQNSKEINKMILLNKSKSKIWINYFRKFTREFIDLKKLLKIGSLQKVTCYYTKGLQNNGSHLLDLIVFFLFGTINDVIVLDRKIHKNYIDVDLILKTNNVNIFVFSADHTSFEIFELDIIGKKGRIEIKKSGSQINFYNVKKSKIIKTIKF